MATLSWQCERYIDVAHHSPCSQMGCTFSLNSRQLHGMELFAGESVAISIARARREASQDLWSTPRVRDFLAMLFNEHLTDKFDL